MALRRFGTLALAVIVVSAVLSDIAAAGEHPITVRRLTLRDPGDPARRRATFRTVADPTLRPSPANDPSLIGATLEMHGTHPGDGSTGVIQLPAPFWTAIGNPPGSRGYWYLDNDATTGVRKVIFVNGSGGGKLVVQARGEQWPYEVIQPQGAVEIRFTVGDEQYCAEIVEFERNSAGRVLARNAPEPLDCSTDICGDGATEGAEECDDGGVSNGDGCSARCQLENASALCTGIPTTNGTGLASERVASGLNAPVGIASAPLVPNRLFVVEQAGRIRVIKHGVLQPNPFLAIEEKVSCCGERGLLGLAFHPRYESNGRFFVNYTNNDGDTVIARYRVSTNDPDDADEASEIILLTIDQDFANHNGGQIAFGPDGYLYAGMGDGGSGGDPNERAQDDASLLGKMLRIDVNVDTPPHHAVPAGNPDAGGGDPLGLRWAKGLRNPWRFSFDRSTGDLYIGDVGQGAREEVDFQPATSTGGENYGWDVFEGTNCFDPAPHFNDCAAATGMTAPIHEYTHAEGCSITGGFVYRGCRMPDLHGTYFYSDYCSAFIRTFRVIGGAAQDHADRTADLAPGGGVSIDGVTSFGEDARGEIYIADQGGEIFRIVPR